MPLSQAWLGVSVPLLLVGIWVLARSIHALVRMTRGSVVASLPVVAEQSLVLPEPGTYDLHVEGRHVNRDFGKLDFAVVDAGGEALRIERLWFGTKVTSFSRVRLQLRRFRVEDAGSVTLRIDGIRPTQDPDNRIVIARPLGFGMVVAIVAIIGGGFLVIGSVIASGLLLALGD